MENKLKVKIISPRDIIFEGYADSVSSTNMEGNFDILPQHANFITVVEDKPINLRLDGKSLVFNFAMTIIYTSENLVNIYTDITSH